MEGCSSIETVPPKEIGESKNDLDAHMVAWLALPRQSFAVCCHHTYSARRRGESNFAGNSALYYVQSLLFCFLKQRKSCGVSDIRA